MLSAQMKGKAVIVTGANAGIGKAAALKLAELGAHVVMVTRDAARGQAAQQEIITTSGNTRVDLLLADLSSQQSIRQLAASIHQGYERIDVLLNNAGGVFGERRLTVDGLEQTFALNHLGYFLLTHLLMDMLKHSAPARIINVSSRAHTGGHINFDDLQSEKNYRAFAVYSQSKLANVLFTYELARRLVGTNVTANCLHPGFVNTRFGRDGDLSGILGHLLGIISPLIARTPERGADTAVYLASAPDLEHVTGKYYDTRKDTRSSAESYDQEMAKRLWAVSEQLVALGEKHEA